MISHCHLPISPPIFFLRYPSKKPGDRLPRNVTAVRTTKGPRLAVHVVDTFDSVLEIVLELGSKDDWRKIRFGPSFNGIYWDLTIIQWDLLGFNHHLIGFNGIKWGHNGFYPPVMMDFPLPCLMTGEKPLGMYIAWNVPVGLSLAIGQNQLTPLLRI